MWFGTTRHHLRKKLLFPVLTFPGVVHIYVVAMGARFLHEWYIQDQGRWHQQTSHFDSGRDVFEQDNEGRNTHSRNSLARART
jgi:hypothetical protein